MAMDISSGENQDPRMARLREVADLVRVEPVEDPAAFEAALKNQIDAVVNPLFTENRKKLIAIMRNPAEPFDEDVKQWTVEQAAENLDQVKKALESLPEIQKIDPDFVKREFTSRGFDLAQAEHTLNTLNSDGKYVGGFGVRRDIRARTIFKATLGHIASLLEEIQEGSAPKERAHADIAQKAELLRNLLSKKLILKRDDPEEGWYE